MLPPENGKMGEDWGRGILEDGEGKRMERLEFEMRRKCWMRRSQLLETEGWLRAGFIHDVQASEVPQHKEAGVG